MFIIGHELIIIVNYHIIHSLTRKTGMLWLTLWGLGKPDIKVNLKAHLGGLLNERWRDIGRSGKDKGVENPRLESGIKGKARKGEGGNAIHST